jgi:hypothetical protein
LGRHRDRYLRLCLPFRALALLADIQ